MCVKQGCYVIFYNEWVDRVYYFVDYWINVVYIEFCEVIVLGNNLYFLFKKKERKYLKIYKSVKIIIQNFNIF